MDLVSAKIKDKMSCVTSIEVQIKCFDNNKTSSVGIKHLMTCQSPTKMRDWNELRHDFTDLLPRNGGMPPKMVLILIMAKPSIQTSLVGGFNPSEKY